MSGDALGLYVHIPWCVRKCPYCDFNSHRVDNTIPEERYLHALTTDLDGELQAFDAKPVLRSIFFGGGTPSLMSGSFYRSLLKAVATRCEFTADIEITLEANPGTIDYQNFSAYRDAGINRLSIGVQSFDDGALQALGRIHTSSAAHVAHETALSAGFTNINIDLMHGLPGQSAAAAMNDLHSAVALEPQHLSWYQLTIEPNTAFYNQIPVLPDEDILSSIYDQGLAFLQSHGLQRYEVSAYAKNGYESRHNLNYWLFGDYLGIGAGAHGKLTQQGRIVRRWKTRVPSDYLRAADSVKSMARSKQLGDDEVILEFMMNALRLKKGFSESQFCRRTGRHIEVLDSPVATAIEKGMLEKKCYAGSDEVWLCATERGYLFLDDLVAIFDR